MKQNELPVWQVMDEVLATVRQDKNLVLVAPPGSGKTTQVAQALLDQRSLEGAIVVVQPRRLACTSVATYIASERGIVIGDEVGYIVRYDGQASANTRLLFLTDGVLLRFLEQDPNLSWAGTVVFDEFHERRVNADLALGLLKQAQARRRNLRLLAMSATMQSDRVAAYLNAVSLATEGRSYQVDVQYDEAVRREEDVLGALPRWVKTLCEKHASGDILVFLPGKEEIRRAKRLLAPLEQTGLTLLELHGELAREEQHRIFLPLETRKVILSTNVAETSVTIPGVRFVIDGGFERRSEFDPDLRINHLNLVRISHASADQRAGRAGREGPGVCVRLWTRAIHKTLMKQTPVEIQQTDVSSTVLTLRSLGIRRAHTFDFLDAPKQDKLEAAEELLIQLGAVGHDDELTPVGWRMLRLPLPPRYARMVVESETHGCVRELATIAALIAGRPIFLSKRPEGVPDPRDTFRRGMSSDFFTLLEMYDVACRHWHDLDDWCLKQGIRTDAFIEADKLREKLIRKAKDRGSFVNKHPADEAIVRHCLLTGLVDMIAKCSPNGTFSVANGMTCTKDRRSVVQGELVAAADIRSRRTQMRKETAVIGTLDLLTEVSNEELARLLQPFTHVVRIPLEFRPETGELLVREETRYQLLVLDWKEIYVNASSIRYVLAEQEARVAHFGWKRVVVQPGINRRGMVLWQGKKISVASDRPGTFWASITTKGTGIAIMLRERLVDAPSLTPIAPVPPTSLEARLARLSPAVGKLLGKS